MKKLRILSTIMLLAGCGEAPEQAQQAQQAQQANHNNLAGASSAPTPQASASTFNAAPSSAPGSPGGPADDRPSLPEPRGPIDPKSVEAAGQVVQHFGALIEQGRWDRAEALWGDARSAQLFSTGLRAEFREVHLEIGALGRTEGAAGSIYTSVPVTFYGQSGRGDPQRRPAAIVLRRVNDVPGSTEAQRRWHIERIEPSPER
jgi:hypothetical protein